MQERDKRILRTLAWKVAEAAHHPAQEVRRRQWYALNRLQPEKPMVFCSPEGAWDELVPAESLETEDPLARSWEMGLRMRLYAWEHFADDQVVDDRFRVRPVLRDTGWGAAPRYVHTQTYKGAYRWEAPLQQPEDLERLHFPEPLYDEEATRRHLELAYEVFDGILRVERRGNFWWSMGLIGEWAKLRGLEQMMVDMCERPQWVHRAMGFLMEGRLRWLERIEALGLLSLNNENDYVGSGGFGFTEELPAPDFDGGSVRLRDLWGFAESQEAVGLSPAMFEEFVLQYQLPILERFGLNCYGCCEPLHDRLHLLLAKVPRLRRISISPWCDRAKAAEALGNHYIFSWKPHPGQVSANPFDPEGIRRAIRETLEMTRGCVVEVILKDTHTCHRQPERFDLWTRIAQEEAQRFADRSS